MPATFFTFSAGTGGVPGDLIVPVGVVPPGSLIIFMEGATGGISPISNTGETFTNFGGTLVKINSAGDPAYTIDMQNGPLTEAAVLGLVLTNPDNISGPFPPFFFGAPFDQFADVTATCGPPASTTHDTTVALCGGNVPGPFTPSLPFTFLVLFSEAGTGSNLVPVFPAVIAGSFSDPTAGDFLISILNPAPAAPYNGSITTNLTANVVLTLLNLLFIPSGPPPGNPILLSSLGVG
jgi:hypothetical protein